MFSFFECFRCLHYTSIKNGDERIKVEVKPREITVELIISIETPKNALESIYTYFRSYSPQYHDDQRKIMFGFDTMEHAEEFKVSLERYLQLEFGNEFLPSNLTVQMYESYHFDSTEDASIYNQTMLEGKGTVYW
jgi:hypothetical protein